MAVIRGIILLAFWFIGVAFFAPFMIGLTWLTGNEDFVYVPIRWFVKVGLALVGVKVVVDGLERLDPNQTYVFTPNHQSFIEVPLLPTYLNRNVAYLAKKDLFKYPVFGVGMQVIRIVPVDRRDSQAAVESARVATEFLRSGKSYVVYPEGTRSLHGRLLPFKKGAFMMAVAAGVPVVPVTISGSAAVMPKGKIRINPSTVHITIHEPISTTPYSRENLGALVQLTRDRILSSLTEEKEQVTGEG